MPVARRPRRLRPLIAVLVVATALPMTLTSSAALAGDDVPARGDTVVGELVQAWAEPQDEVEAAERVHAEPLTWIETDAGEAVRVPTRQVGDLPVGATVEVAVGKEVADRASAETGIEPAREVLSAEVVAPAPADGGTTAPASGPLTNEVTVAMVVPAGGTQDSTTLTQVVDAVNGPVAQFWSSESQGSIRVGVTASHDWMTTTATCAQPTAMWNEVASAVGFTAGPGKHLLLYVTGTPAGLPGCSYGLAQVGSTPGSGGRLYVRDTLTSLIAHELGHNFGLGHSSGRQCDRAVETGTCRTQAYRDYYDVMGVSWEQVGSLNASQAALIGLLPAAQQRTVKTSSAGEVVTLAPLSGRSGVRGVRLEDVDGVAYWLEYRPPTGQDAWLGAGATNPYRLESGVLLHRSGSGPDTSLLLDGSPAATAGWDADLQTALPVGAGVPVSGGDFSVTVQSVSASGAQIRVQPSLAARLAANRQPVGALDPVAVTGSSLGVSGWAVDPDTPADPSQVHVYVDGQGVPLIAGSTRPESLTVPGAGDTHGFAWSVPVSAGEHRVCVYAVDTTPGGGNSGLGCRTVSAASRLPVGMLEQFGVTGSTLTVAGWAFDPDAPASSIQVHIYADGRGVPMYAAGSSGPSATPLMTAEHGFSWSTALSGGRHQVCVYAIDATAGMGSTVLGCQAVTVVMNPPVGALERLAVSGSDVTVTGWALDPDAPTSPIQVHIYVDGRGLPVLTGTAPAAGYPTALEQSAFTGTLSLSRGAHRVCAYALDHEGVAGNTVLGCRSVDV